MYIQLLDDYGSPTVPVYTELFVINGLGDEIIIGLPDILGLYFEFFVSALTCGRNGTKLSVMSEYDHAIFIMDAVRREIAKPNVRTRTIRRAQTKLKSVFAGYDKRKQLVLHDPMSLRVIHSGPTGASHEVVASRRLAP